MAALMDYYTAITTLVLASFVAILYVVFRRNSGRGLPPGPRGLPVVGYLPFLTRSPHVKLMGIRREYGPVFSIKFGSHNLVVLCDFKSIRDAFVQDAMMGIPPLTPLQFHKETIDSEAMSGIKWKEQRRFSLHLFRDLGLARTQMEGHLKEEILFVLEHIEQDCDQPISIRPILTPSMSNNISSLVFGRRMQYNDPKRILLDNILKESLELGGQMAIAVFFPWVKTLMSLFRFRGLEKWNATNDKLNQFLSNEIEEHEKTLDPENIRDFIDGYLVQIHKKKDDPNTTFLKGVLQNVVGAFFGGGSATVRITVEWLVLVNVAFPDVQRRIQAEIEEVIGTERFPKYADHSEMPYTQAVIMEVLRWRTTLPLNFFREALADTHINSFPIKKGTYVLGNQWSVHHDPSLYSHPETFRPERFLTADGKGVHKPEHYIPFSIGKRACPGESFAYIEIFLYLTAILQKFNIRAPEGAAINMEGEFGMALQSKEQEVIFQLRQ